MKEFSPKSKFYFAGSSEMFGKTVETPQNENTRFYPRSAYGISKVTGFEFTRNYREAYNLFTSTGILFNHESPRRGFEFVTRKISLAVAKIKNNLQKDLKLGNIDAKRDWGHAKDYVEAMWLMLQQNKPEDYVIGTGVQHSVKEFLEIAFNFVGLKYQDYVKVDKSFFRPAEVETLLADPSNSKKKLRWTPKINFENLVKEMVNSDLKNIKDNII
jgi:GDPmannose 4,6-dehydratase